MKSGRLAGNAFTFIFWNAKSLSNFACDLELPEETNREIEGGTYPFMYTIFYNRKFFFITNGPKFCKSIRLFIVDTKPFADREDEDEEFTAEEKKELAEFKRVFINAKIVEETGEEWPFNEGCLSIPKIREDVIRKPKIRIKYVDENFLKHDEVHEGLIARVIQHEYDHIEGKLFTDKISPLRRRLLQGRLNDISKGKVKVTYKMKFPNK